MYGLVVIIQKQIAGGLFSGDKLLYGNTEIGELS